MDCFYSHWELWSDLLLGKHGSLNAKAMVEDGTEGSSWEKSLTCNGGLAIPAGLLLLGGCTRSSRGMQLPGEGCGCSLCRSSATGEKISPLSADILGCLLAASRDGWHSICPQKSCQLKAARNWEFINKSCACLLLHSTLDAAEQKRVHHTLHLCKMFCSFMVSL